MFDQKNTTFTKRFITLNIATLFISQPMFAADIVLDTRGYTAGHTTLDTARNGVPVVNIARPNSSGVSHNQYINFNVPTKGTILNNSGKEVSTKLSGYIYGNENMKNASASLILNEVTGTNRSQLKGYIEVAGTSADVIVANPNGITVNGAGFINTPKATLTTAKVSMSGSRPGFDVNGGDVKIEGNGIDASKSNLDIYAQSIKLNADIHAKKLKLLFGKNTIDASGKVTSKADNTGGYGLDSSALGGIYANAITLIGTQRGVGVNLPGEMLLQNSLSITVDGEIALGKALAKGDMALKSKSSDITIDKGAHAKNLSLDAKGIITLNANTGATNNVDIKASSFVNEDVLAAGVNADFSEASRGILTLNVVAKVTNNSSLFAKDAININSNDFLNAQDASVMTNTLNIENVHLLENEGTVNAGDTTLSATTVINTELIHANGDLTVNAQSLDSSDAVIEGLGKVNLNVSGDIHVDRGTLYAEGETAITADNLSGTEGEILLQDVTIEVSKTVDLDDGYIEAETLDLDAKELLANNAQILSLGALALTTQTIQADTSTIQAVGDIAIHSDVSFQQNDAALLYSEANIEIGTNTFSHTDGSELFSLSDTVIDATTLDNSDSSVVAKNISITAEEIDNSNAELLTSESLEITADTLDNTEGIIQANENADISATGDMDNTRGVLYSSEDIAMGAGTLNNEDGFIGSSKKVSVESTHLTGDRGTLSGDGVSVVTETASIDSAVFESTDTLDIAASGDVTLTSATLLANNQLNLTAHDTILDGSTLYSVHEGIALNTNKLQAIDAYIEANTILGMDASDDVDISGSTLRADEVDLNADGDITANGTDVVAVTELNIRGNSLTHSNGQFISDGNVNVTLNGTLKQENNSSILSYGSATVATNNYYLSGTSTLYSDKSLIINIGNTLEHTDKSRIITTDTAHIVAEALTQNNALIYAANGATFNTETFNTTDATISGERTQINTTNFNNINGDFYSDSDSVDIIATGTISNTNGVMSVNGDFTLEAHKVISDYGEFESGATLKATSQNMQVNNARFFGTEYLDISTSLGTIDAGSKLLSLDTMKLDFAGNVINYGEITANGAYGGESDIDIGGSLTNYGDINSGYTLHLDTVNITNFGKIQGGGFTTVNLSGTLDNHGFFTSSYDLDLKAGTINNSAGIASGNDLTLRATNLMNTNTLYSGRDMMLYVSDTVNNSKDIYAGQDLMIAGDESLAKTGTISNYKGTIESYRDMYLYANNITNTGTSSISYETSYLNLITGELMSKEEMDAWILLREGYYEFGDEKFRGVNALLDEYELLDKVVETYGSEPHRTGSSGFGDDDEYNSAPPWVEFQTSLSGDVSVKPAYIISGNDLTINAGKFVNTDSTISSARNMTINAGTIQNVPSSVTVDIESIVNNVSWEYIDNSWTTNDDTALTIHYDAPVITEQKIIESVSQILVGGAFTGNIGNFINGGGTPLDSTGGTAVNTDTGSTSDSQSSIGRVDSTVYQGNVEDQSHSASQTNKDALIVTKLDINPTIYNPNTAKVELPNNPYGIFVTNPKPTGPLIEFNPEYTNYNEYVSSDYLLERLGYDGTEQTRRLGDAMYETQLVRNSIMAMTGQRYVGDATNDAELYINLLDGGVKFAKEVGLTLGVAPTVAQLARISEDMVWLVEKNVGGHTVLAPVVYLAHTYDGAKGGHIDADSINLNISGHLANSGNINTHTDMTLKVNTLTNAGGNIEAGRNMNIAAIGDIKNLSGSIKGGSVVLKSSNGNIINETVTSTVSMANKLGKHDYTVLGKTSSIEATNGSLVLDAGKNIENIGADLISSGNIGLSAGENVEVTTIKDERTYDYTMPHGTSSGESVTHIQSNIQAGGTVSIASGDDVDLEAVNIKAANTVISSKGTVNLTAVVDSKLAQSHTEKDGFLSSSSTTDMTLEQSVKGTKIETDTLVIQGKGGVELESATVNAANAVHFSSSEGDVTLSAKSYTNASSHEETNSILGGLYESREHDSMSETLLADSSTSAKNSIMVAGENVNIVATDLSTNNGVIQLLAKQNINIMSGIEASTATHVEEKEGISLGYNEGRFTFSEKSSDSAGSTSYTNKASNIDTDTLILKSGQDTNIIASNVTADTMIVNAQRDYNVLSAKDITVTNTEHSKEESGIKFTLNAREASVFAGYWEEQSGEDTTVSKVVSSNINVGTLSVNSENTNVVGSNITGRDIAIHSENIRILNDSTETNTDAYTHNIRTGVEVGVKQNLFNVVDTAKGLKDVKSGSALIAGGLQTYDAVQGFAEKPVTGGVYAIHEESSTNAHSENSNVVASRVTASNSLTLKANNELEIAGSDVGSANALNIYANTINIHAAQSTYSVQTESEMNNANIGLYGDHMGQATVAYQENEMSTTGAVQRNSQIYAGGAANIISHGDTTLSGANIDARDLQLTVGGNLNIESLQDTQSIVGSSSGGSISAGLGGLSGASVNAGETSGEKAWVSQVTSINGRESTRVNVGGTTTLTGASITNIDANGIDQGNLVLNTKHLVLNDIIDIDTFDSTTVGIGSSTGEGKTPELTSVNYTNNSKDKEQITRATIGKGTINTGSIAGELNRDITKIQEITKDEESNTEFYMSDKTLALVKNPTGEIATLKNNLRDVGLAAHVEIMNNLPSASKGNNGKGDLLDNTIGKVLDSTNNLGILPSVGNAGGYVTQIATQLFGDNRNILVVKDKDKLLELGINENDISAVSRRNEITGEVIITYTTDPDKTVRIDEKIDKNDPLDAYKIHVSSEEIAELGITLDHLFTNGMFNDPSTAIYNQQTQQGGADALLNYNQMHGVLGDMIENVQDHVTSNTGLGSLGTGSSRQTGDIIEQMTSINNGHIVLGAHSQGTMMTQNGLDQHQEILANIVQSNVDSQFLVQYSGAPVNHYVAEDMITDIYGGKTNIIKRTNRDGISNVFRSHVAPEDFVGTVLGGQSAGINNSENLGENIVKATGAVTDLFGWPDSSAHSYYGCVIGCGDDRSTPDIRNYINGNAKDGESLRVDDYTNRLPHIDQRLLPQLKQPSQNSNNNQRTIIDTTGGK